MLTLQNVTFSFIEIHFLLSFFVDSELRNALVEFLNAENSKPVSQALSLRICYLLKKEIRNGTFTMKELDMKLFLDGKVLILYFIFGGTFHGYCFLNYIASLFSFSVEFKDFQVDLLS